MTTKGEWVAYTRSNEQIAELKSAKNGVLIRLLDDIKGENEFILQRCDDFHRSISEYWIIPDDPLREMKIRQAQTGQPVWQRYPTHRFEWDSSLGNVMVDYIKTEVTTTPNWHIPNAEYSFTPFDNGLTSMKVPVIAHIRKNQPRRKLSAQEIAEDYDPSAPNGYD